MIRKCLGPKFMATLMILTSSVVLVVASAPAFQSTPILGVSLSADLLPQIRGATPFSACTTTGYDCNSALSPCPFLLPGIPMPLPPWTPPTCSKCTPNYLDASCTFSWYSSCTSGIVQWCGNEYTGTCSMMAADLATNCVPPLTFVGGCTGVSVAGCSTSIWPASDTQTIFTPLF